MSEVTVPLNFKAGEVNKCGRLYPKAELNRQLEGLVNKPVTIEFDPERESGVITKVDTSRQPVSFDMTITDMDIAAKIKSGALLCTTKCLVDTDKIKDSVVTEFELQGVGLVPNDAG